MRRAIKPKSSPLRRLLGGGDGAGTNNGGGVPGGDCAGVKEPLPVMPLEVSAGGALWPVEKVGGAAPGPLPIAAAGVLCPPLDDGANDEPAAPLEAGGGVEVFTSGSAGEDGAVPGDRLVGLGVGKAGISLVPEG